MKKRLLNVAMVMLPFLGFAQIGGSVVYDPTQAMNMTTQIQNTTTQINQLEKSLEYMQKAEEKVSEVSGYLRDLEDLKIILKKQKYCIDAAKKIRQNIGKTSIENQRVVLSSVSHSLGRIHSSVSFINKILTSNFFKMTDKDRMDLIDREKGKVHIAYLKIKRQLLILR